MGEAAEVIAPATDAPAGGAPAGGDSSQGGSAAPAPSTPPQGTSPEGQPVPTGPREVPDPTVPWGKFREVQTEFTRFRRQADQARQQYEQQLKQYKQQLDELKGYKDDFTTLEQILNANPELAQQLQQVAAQGGAVRTQAQANAVAQLPPEVQATLKEVAELKQMLAQDRQQQLLRKQADEDRQVSEKLDTTLTKTLAERGYDEAWLPHLRGYVLERARQLPTLDFDDLPYLVAEWMKPMQSLLHKQMERWKDGKRSDATLPPSPGVTPPVTGSPNMGALDDKTSATALEMLLSRGWKNGE